MARNDQQSLTDAVGRLVTKVGQAVEHKTEQMGISAACYAARRFVDLQRGRTSDVDAAPMKLAQWVMMKPGGRAERYLDHFLAGSGAPEYFEAHELLASEKLVRLRVETEINRKRLGIRVGTEKA